MCPGHHEPTGTYALFTDLECAAAASSPPRRLRIVGAAPSPFAARCSFRSSSFRSSCIDTDRDRGETDARNRLQAVVRMPDAPDGLTEGDVTDVGPSCTRPPAFRGGRGRPPPGLRAPTAASGT